MCYIGYFIALISYKLFAIPNLSPIINFYQTSLKLAFETEFLVQNNCWNLCVLFVNLERTHCSQIAGIKYWYL